MRCYVLVGGRSRRMGRSKASLLLEGDSFLQRVVRAASVFEEVVLVGKYAPPGLTHRFLQDRPDLPQAAISGVLTALLDASEERVWIIAVDYPLVSANILEVLRRRFERSEADMVIPLDQTRPQPLCAGYRRRLVPWIEANLQAGDLSLRALMSKAETELVSIEELGDFSGRPFRNVNDPADYEEVLNQHDQAG